VKIVEEAVKKTRGMNALTSAVEALILMKIGNGGEEEAGSHFVALRHNNGSSKERGVKTSNIFLLLGCRV
jgi:hypothetical protein